MPSRLRAPLVSVALAFCLSCATARAEPSASDQEACTPDVFKICSASIPSESAIVACLNAHVPELSPPCRAVIDPPHAKRKRRAQRS